MVVVTAMAVMMVMTVMMMMPVMKMMMLMMTVMRAHQVRVLRGLGAIQPGVNRCKLIADSDFDTLYKDCTTSR